MISFPATGPFGLSCLSARFASCSICKCIQNRSPTFNMHSRIHIGDVRYVYRKENTWRNPKKIKTWEGKSKLIEKINRSKFLFLQPFWKLTSKLMCFMSECFFCFCFTRKNYKLFATCCYCLSLWAVIIHFLSCYDIFSIITYYYIFFVFFFYKANLNLKFKEETSLFDEQIILELPLRLPFFS